MTKTASLLALACILIVGAAVLSVMARDSVPAAGSGSSVTGPSANRETKKDKLQVAAAALASSRQAETALERAFPELSAPLRQAFASDSPADLPASQPAPMVRSIPQIPAAQAATPQPVATPQDTTASLGSAPAPQPPKKLAAKPPAPATAQKNYTLLSDAQIAAIKGRLNLSSSQEAYWPGVEGALRAIAKKMHASRQGNPASAAAQIDPDSDEVQQLKSAAMPLLFQLREDQKQEVRSLARIIGLHQVAAAI